MKKGLTDDTINFYNYDKGRWKRIQQRRQQQIQQKRQQKEKHESENSHDTTSESEDDYNDIYTVRLERIMDWIDSGACPVSFDDSTIRGIKEYSEKSYFKGFSSIQESTIDNIYNGFRVEKWFNKHN